MLQLKSEITAEPDTLNRVGLILLPICVLVPGLLFYLLFGWSRVEAEWQFFYRWFFVVFFVGILLHEGLHGLACGAFAGFRSVSFGISRQMFTVYTHCNKPLRKWQYVFSCLLPGVLLGIVPLILAFIYPSAGFLFWGMLFTWAATGDFWVVYLLRSERWMVWVSDHKQKAGCQIWDEVDN
jgi:hypothetical protein